MGSRNGHAPIFLWYTLNRKGYKGFQKEVQKCVRNAHYLKGRLLDAGISVMLNELSSTVVFERPQDEEFVRRWQLACQGKDQPPCVAADIGNENCICALHKQHKGGEVYGNETVIDSNYVDGRSELDIGQYGKEDEMKISSGKLSV
ncbi:hypothetical protein JRO89_XS07G0221800 [Xanthoceras sorbifolium]|uniref:Transposase n=1 Tax=Xanthoceras sorbifolium TaxID=99658 RepID=A0ABQ8HUK1_9ROSI|nr:hypothetical protein JRO89_XS07G0221800 [Xanthoceras sorbifolium]